MFGRTCVWMLLAKPNSVSAILLRFSLFHCSLLYRYYVVVGLKLSFVWLESLNIVYWVLLLFLFWPAFNRDVWNLLILRIASTRTRMIVDAVEEHVVHTWVRGISVSLALLILVFLFYQFQFVGRPFENDTGMLPVSFHHLFRGYQQHYATLSHRVMATIIRSHWVVKMNLI